MNPSLTWKPGGFGIRRGTVSSVLSGHIQTAHGVSHSAWRRGARHMHGLRIPYSNNAPTAGSGYQRQALRQPRGVVRPTYHTSMLLFLIGC